MATLVLTAVGTALGGPIGGALGALAGQAFDHGVLFRSGAREGPRLTELRVQTSSYGSAIPRLFGTMRVAGTVIWSTDLIETRTVARVGKGQPGVARYSYRASFAVLLSARPVTAIGRVWADGDLIRGAAGDWKVSTGFRLHPGAEDQAADPLIASAEGAGGEGGGLAPAHRGCAYVVFEDLALEQFGNRLPSLTFEVTADAGPIGVGTIAAALAPEVGGDVALAVDGLASTGGSVAAVLDTLAQASGAWFAPTGSGLAMRDGGLSVAMVTPQLDRAATRAVAAADKAPAVVTVSHYDPARDWQAGLQRVRRVGGAGTTTLTLEVPAAVSAAAAKGIAANALARAAAARVRRTVPATLAALSLGPGDVVTLTNEAGLWRVEEVALEAGMATTLTLVPLPAGAGTARATSGRVSAAPDLPIGATLLYAAELPPLDDAVPVQPRLTVVANGAGAGWRAAALMLSLDDGASWTEAGSTAAPGIVGTVEAPLPAGQAALIDRTASLVVRLARADMALADADAAALDGGANLALVGDELLQFGRAEPLGGARWRLSALWRGRRGTTPATGVAGDRFVLIEADAARTIDLPLAALGSSVRVMAAGVGEGGAPPVVAVAVTGASVLPPAPIALRWTATADGGADLTWTRRSRAGWRWLDGVDAPLGEEREAYRITVGAAGGTRELVASAPTVAVTAAERGGGPVTVTVRQRGTFGESAPTTITID